MTVIPVGANTSDSSCTTAPVGISTADPFTASNVTWEEAIGSTSENWAGFTINAFFSVVRPAILQIAIGAVSAEVIIATLPLSLARAVYANSYYIPIAIPSGTRVSIGGHCALSGNIVCQIVGQPSSDFDSDPSFTVMESGPYDLDDYTNLLWRYDPGGTANTKPGYEELSLTGGTNRSNNVINGDSLAQSYDYLGWHLAEINTFQSDHNRLWDLARGAVSSEVVFASNYHQFVSGFENTSTVGVQWDKWGRASGDRISVNMQSSGINDTDRLGTAVLFGLR